MHRVERHRGRHRGGTSMVRALLRRPLRALLRRPLRPLAAVGALALALAPVASAGPSSTADMAAPTPSPAPIPLSDVPRIPFERFRLDNGLEVILHSDRSLPMIAVDVWYHVGSGDETPGKSGFAHLFEHMMFQGAKHVGRDVHFEILREVGATSVNGTTNTDRTNYYEVVPSNEVETALWLESDRMGYLLDMLDEDALANQREVVRNERRQRYDDVPYGKDRFAVAEALYPDGHPYRYLTIGRHRDIEAATLDDVRAFFLEWYVPSNATLVLAGDIDPDEGRALVEKWFGTFPSLPRPEHEVKIPPPLPATVRQEIDDPLARLARLHYAWLSPARLSPGDAEMVLLASVLGTAGWGRLQQRLVVERRLAQRVSVHQQGMGFGGAFHLVVDIEPGHTVAEVEPVVQAEVQRVIDDAVDDQELLRAVNRIEAGFVWGLEDLLSRAERLQFFAHYADDPGYAPTYLETYRSRTPEMVHRVAAEILGAPRVEIVTRPGGAAPEKKDGK